MEIIPVPGAEIYYDKDFLPAKEATILFNRSTFKVRLAAVAARVQAPSPGFRNCFP